VPAVVSSRLPPPPPLRSLADGEIYNRPPSYMSYYHFPLFRGKCASLIPSRRRRRRRRRMSRQREITKKLYIVPQYASAYTVVVD